MLRPLYRQQYSLLARGRASPLLLSSLRLWRRYPVTEPIAVVEEPRRRVAVHVFTDAAGETRRICVITFADGARYATDMEVPQDVLWMLRTRNDEQILALEMVAVLVALSSFGDILLEKPVVFHIDNQGVVGMLRAGAARAPDHNLMSFSFWSNVASMRIGVWIEWVPSALNIADGPTRYVFSFYSLLTTH